MSSIYFLIFQIKYTKEEKTKLYDTFFYKKKTKLYEKEYIDAKLYIIYDVKLSTPILFGRNKSGRWAIHMCQ